MTLGSDQLSHDMRQRIHGRDMKYGERVFAILHTSVVENVGNEMYASISQQWQGGRVRQKLDVDH